MVNRTVLLVLLFSAWLILEPRPEFESLVLQNALRALAVSALFFGLCIGVGAFVLRRLNSTKTPAWDMAFGLGFAVWGAMAFLVSAAGLMGHLSAAFIVLAMVICSIQSFPIEKPTGPKLGMVMIALVALLSIGDALGPVVDTDAVYYHVALPKQIWLGGELLGGPLHPNGSRPMLFHAPYSMLFGWGGETALPLFSWLTGLALAASVLQRAEAIQLHSGLWALLLLFSSWTFLHELGVGANNLMTAFLVWTCWLAIRQDNITMASVLAAAALSVKYTAFGVIAALWLLLIQGNSKKFKAFLIVSGAVSVWLLWNLFNGLHPLFPYSGWNLDFPFQHLDKYGMGRDGLNALLLPYNAVMHAEIDTFRFLGQLHPLWLLGAPLAIGSLSKNPRLGWVVLLALIFWGLGPHWLRHLLPAMPLIAFFLALGLSRLSKSGILVAAVIWVWGLPANVGPMLVHWGERLTAVSNERDADVYRNEKIPSWRAAEWANNRLPTNSKCAVFYAWPGLAFDRPYVLGSVEDHVPSRHFLLSHRDEFVQALSQEGVDHLLVGPSHLARHLYPFLSDEEFRTQFTEAQHILEKGLLRDGELIFEASSHRIYRIRK